MPGSTRGNGRRQRPRTAPDVSLSPVERGYNLAAHGRSRGAVGGGRVPAGRSTRAAAGGSEADAGAGGGSPAEQPELLSRFIPADPWVGRVSLSSPQALSGLVTAMGKHGGGGASSAPSPNGITVVVNGNNDNSNSNSNNLRSSSSISSTVGLSSSNEQGAGAGGMLGLKGMTGLRNEGNWCYLNASLQALARCSPFRAHLLECVPTPNVAGRPCPLAYSMSELYTEMWSEDTSVGGGGKRRAAETPASVLRALVKGNRWFAGNGQHDAHEALRSILDLLHEELRRPVPASFEPGHAALTAAMAASSAESAAADAAATAPATAAPDESNDEDGRRQSVSRAAAMDAEVASAKAAIADKQQKLSIEGKATTPPMAAGGAWTVSGGWEGSERSTKRVTSAEGTVAQQQQQRDVYWQSAAAETFQGVLIGRITCRTCGRHSDQPDRFYDLSVPLLAGSAGSAASAATNGSAAAAGGPPPAAATVASALSSSATGRGDRHRPYDYHNHHHNSVTPGGAGAGIITPTMESPRPGWEPSLNSGAGDANGGDKRMTSIRSSTTVGDSEAAGGDRSSDWGTWRRTRGGWCSAARDDEEVSGVGGSQDGAGGRSGGGGRAPSYLGGLASSLGVWLGFKSVALEDCLEAFFSPERLRGANQYHCDGCGSKKEADKSTSLLHAPEILVLHVKRFRRGYLWSHKVHNRVVFPLHDLDMSRWLSEHAAESSANQQRVSAAGSGGDAHRKSSLRRGGGSPDGGGYYYGGSTATAAAVAAAESAAAAFSPSSPAPVLYDLVGLVQHTGGLEHGHYTSFTRDDGSAAWHHFNDTTVTRVSQETVSSASPYILFYRRKRPSSSSSSSPGTGPSGMSQSSRPMSMSAAASAAATAAAATAAAATGTASLLSSVGIGPAAEEARDVRSRVEIMAREMAKAGGGGAGGTAGGGGGGGGGGASNNASSSSAGAVGAEAAAAATAAAAAAGDGQARMSIGGGGAGGGGGVSDTDGEGAGGGGGARSRLSRRRKGRGRRPGSESESEGSTGGSNSWVYMSKAWALKWATSAYPGPVSNHHVVCRHGRVKPNIGVKRATKEMVAVPRGVHRSLVNRYGPRTPAMVPAKPSPLGGNGGIMAPTVPGESASRVSVGRGRGRGHGMALVGSSRPLLELSSCTACKALEEEMAMLKSTEQKEVAGLSKVGQERRKRRKAARSARQRRRAIEGATPESDARHDSGDGSVVVLDAATVDPSPSGGGGGGDGREGQDDPARAADADVGGEGGSAETTAAAADDVDGGEQEGSAPGDGAGGGGDGVSASGDGDDDDDGAGSDEDRTAGAPLAPAEDGEEDGYGDDEDEEGGEDEEEDEEEEKWFLMAGTWLSRWHAYVLSGSGEDLDFPTPPPGPITNGDLVDEDSVPIPGKVAGKHYRGAMIEVWSYLHRRYGGGPVVCRSDPDGLYEKKTAESSGSSS